MAPMEDGTPEEPISGFEYDDRHSLVLFFYRPPSVTQFGVAQWAAGVTKNVRVKLATGVQVLYRPLVHPRHHHQLPHGRPARGHRLGNGMEWTVTPARSWNGMEWDTGSVMEWNGM